VGINVTTSQFTGGQERGRWNAANRLSAREPSQRSWLGHAMQATPCMHKFT
jgi:hypothetical protein